MSMAPSSRPNEPKPPAASHCVALAYAAPIRAARRYGAAENSGVMKWREQASPMAPARR